MVQQGECLKFSGSNPPIRVDLWNPFRIAFDIIDDPQFAAVTVERVTRNWVARDSKRLNAPTYQTSLLRMRRFKDRRNERLRGMLAQASFGHRGELSLIAYHRL